MGYLKEAEYRGHQSPSASYSDVESLLITKPRTLFHKIRKDESIKLKPAKTPNMCTYNPNNLNAPIVTKIVKDKFNRYYDQDIKRSKLVPPVGRYDVSGS